MIGEGTYWCATTNQLAFTTEPLTLWNERHAVTVLMYCKIAPVTKDDGVGVLAVTIVTDSTLAVLLFAATSGGLSIDRSCGARTRSVCLRGLRIGFWDA